MNGMLPTRLLVLVLLRQRPVACTSTTKIVVKVNGKKPWDRPKNPLEVSLEARTFNNLVVTSLKKDRHKVQLVKPLSGFKELQTVCVEGISSPSIPLSNICSVNAAAATLFGDTEDANNNQQLHDQGKAQQRSAEA